MQETKGNEKAAPEGDREAESSPKQDILTWFESHGGERHVIVIQDFPDPDAISSAFAHQMIAAEFDTEADIVYAERISHQENVALVRLLGIDLARYSEAFDLTQYDGAVYVDNQGTTAGALVRALQEHDVPTLAVIDHHELQGRLQPEFADIRRVGAAATLYAEYLALGLLEMQKSRDEHVTLATALMHGIITDTHRFVRATAADFEAAAFLSRYRDADLLEQILSQARSKQTMEVIRQALGNRVTEESFTIAGIGYVRPEDRDAIPQAADFLLTEENVHTAIVYGIVSGSDHSEVLVGSMRTSKLTLDPDAFIKEALGQDVAGRYFGGGKWSDGGFEIPVGFLSGGRAPDFLERKWQVYDEQIKQKVFGKIGVQQASRG